MINSMVLLEHFGTLPLDSVEQTGPVGLSVGPVRRFEMSDTSLNAPVVAVL